MTNSQSRDTVLVIDDDPNLRAMICDIGDISGVRVVEASDCCEGLKVLEQEFSRVKIVLMDYFMPGMSSLDCANALKAKVEGTQIPVVLVTAAVDPAERATELKLTYWLSKPFDIPRLEQIMVTGKF